MNPPGTAIPFVKASACENDFLIIDGMHAPADLAAFSRRICDRHQGVGADGVEWLFPATDADVRARLFNADGSEAEISGNGTRCVAAYLCAEQPREKVLVRTGAGVKTCALIARNGPQFEFEIAMGEPQVGDEFSIKLAFREVRGIPVSMGNPHYVVFVDDFVPGWQGEAAEIGRHHDFKYGINVELVRVKDPKEIEARFFERGVGETQSSGTGSCAAAVAAITAQRAQSPVRVATPGGVQTVRWEQQVFLRGPAQLACRGEFFV
ncbi:MAG TPA: diaminopimelate epimerase [Terriglobales bacterium]|jgi:diaminopimelate epimerase|nr:diaminopimelate epimerase [Terriglobales bacterium]